MLGPTPVAAVAAPLAGSTCQERLECQGDARRRQALGYLPVAQAAVDNVPSAGLFRSPANALQRPRVDRGWSPHPPPPRPCCAPPLSLPLLCYLAHRSPPSDTSSSLDFRVR